MNEVFTELEDIHNKYERLQSLVEVMQMFVAEVVEVAGASTDCLKNALFEVEIEMGNTNDRLKSIIAQKGGAV